MKKLACLPWLLLMLLTLACDRRVAPYVPPEQEPPAPSRPVRIPGLQNPVPREPQLTRPAAGGVIRGTVSLAAGVEAPGQGVLFVIARTPGGGPPLAVKRLPVSSFPLAFELGPADVMLRGRPFQGPILLTARIDRDGNPLTREAGELVAELPQPLEPGATGARLVLRHSGS